MTERYRLLVERILENEFDAHTERSDFVPLVRVTNMPAGRGQITECLFRLVEFEVVDEVDPGPDAA